VRQVSRDVHQSGKESHMSMEILNKLFSAVERNDIDSYLTCFHENAEYKAGNYPAVYGHAAIKAFAGQVIPIFDKVEHKVKNTWQNGNVIVSEMELTYHRKDGKVTTVPCTDIIELEDGKVKSLRAYLDAAPAFA
jgi:ketosteroid isomerase-like protein